MTDKMLIDRSVLEQASKLLQALSVDDNYGYAGDFRYWENYEPPEKLASTLRAALEQPQVGEVVVTTNQQGQCVAVTRQDDEGQILSVIWQAEQPRVEHEPVAWIERWYGSGPERGWWIVCGRDHIAHLGPAEMSGEAASKIVSAHNTSPPAQRQPLTDEWIRMIYDECDAETGDEFIFAFARAIERAHGIVGE